MEKEIEISSKHCLLNYQGTNFESLEICLNSLCNVFETFLLEDLGVEAETLSFNLSLCSSEKIIQLNSDYREKNKITDVLSFPIQDDLRAGEYDDFLPEIELGDIYICQEVCAKQALEFELEFREEFLHLAVHGFLHLCGYDHEINENEEKLMEKLELDLIKRISDLGSF